MKLTAEEQSIVEEQGAIDGTDGAMHALYLLYALTCAEDKVEKESII